MGSPPDPRRRRERRGLALALAWALALGACDEAPREGSPRASGSPARGDGSGSPPADTGTAEVAPSASLALPSPGDPAPTGRDTLTLIAGGDIFFGRVVGQVLLAKRDLDVFEHVRGWLDGADVRFGNLECQLSDQKGVTVHPENHLVFTGPPQGADALKRARFDIVSLANNHMWDFGKDALWETFTHLERVGVAYVGAGRERERAYGAVMLERHGFKLAFVAVTDIWNMGALSRHPAREFVARADPALVRETIAPLAADPNIDAVVFSYHGGSEYMEEPTLQTREVIHAAVDAGADVVLGHHPHVAQGISWYGGKPVLYSLGNFTMGMKGEHPWSRFGYLARVTFAKQRPGGRRSVPAIAVCPFLIDYFTPKPLSDPAYGGQQGQFFRKLRALSDRVAGSDVAEPGADGCATVTAPARPFPGSIP